MSLRRKEEEHAVRQAQYSLDATVYNEVLPGYEADWRTLTVFAADLGFSI